MRGIRFAAAAVCFLGLFALLVMGITPLLTRITPQFYLTLWDLRQKGEVQTALIGDSQCLYMIDPRLVGEQTGRSTFNLAVHGGRTESFQAFAEEMVARGTKQIVIFYDPMDAYHFEDADGDIPAIENPYVEMIASNFLTSPVRKMAYFLRCSVRYGRWLDRAFPWRFYGFMRPEDAVVNLARRLYRDEARAEAMQIIDANSHLDYRGDGFIERHLSTAWQQRETDEQLTVRGTEGVWLSDGKKRSYLSLAGLCRAKGCDLLILQTPWHSRKQRLDEHYRESTRQMEEFCGQNGIAYYDLALMRPDILPSLDEYYYDYDHFSEEGARIFSRALGQFLACRQSGGDAAGMFVSRQAHMEALERAAAAEKEGMR